MINFAVGPVMSDKETLELGKDQVPYFRTPEFSELMKDNERILKNLFDVDSDGRVVFLTSSGTGAMEACTINLFSKSDKVLVVNGGTFGNRLVELCKLHEIPFEEIKLGFGTSLLKDRLHQYNGEDFTGMMVQLCETSSGVLYDMEMIGEFCRKNNIFLFVDAVSGFLADKFSMKKMGVNAAITGSQKALGLPPGIAICVLDKTALERVEKINPHSMYFDFSEYLKNMERGQTPFTPAVSVLIQLNEKLKRLENDGGIENQNKAIAEKAEYFRSQIQGLPFKMFVPKESASNCVTALEVTGSKLNAKEIFEIMKNEYGIWICPNGGEYAERMFRIGHIGSVTKDDIDTLLNAFKDMKEKGML